MKQNHDKKSIDWTRALPPQQTTRMTVKSHDWQSGERVGIYQFIGYVGDNPTGLYLRFTCDCGAVRTIHRRLWSSLKEQSRCRKCPKDVPNATV